MDLGFPRPLNSNTQFKHSNTQIQVPYLLERAPMLERAPPSNERPSFLSKEALV